MIKVVSGAILMALATATAVATAQPASAQGWHDRRDWERRHGDRWDHRRDVHRPFRCEARALRLGGSGPPVPGVGGVGFGRDACGEALFKCRRELRFVQSTGRAPLATCEIVGRH